MAKGKIISQLWRLGYERLLGVGGKQKSLSDKSVENYLNKYVKETVKKLTRIDKTEFKKLDYIKDVKKWVKIANETPDKTVKREALYVLSNFAEDSTASSVMGLRQAQAEFIAEQIDKGLLPEKLSKKRKREEYFKYQKYVSDFRDRVLQSGKAYNDETSSRVYRFKKWKGVKSLREFGSSEDIRREMYNWQMQGEPSPWEKSKK